MALLTNAAAKHIDILNLEESILKVDDNDPKRFSKLQK